MNILLKFVIKSLKMKDLKFYIYCIFLCFTFIACEKSETEEDSDKFVGTYSLSVVEHVVWGNDSGTINDNGTLTIEKISDSKVRVYGYNIYTTGEVSGSLLQLEGTYASDSEGYYTASFSTGVLTGNILKFTANHTGKLKYNGILYPYRNTIEYTAVKNY